MMPTFQGPKVRHLTAQAKGLGDCRVMVMSPDGATHPRSRPFRAEIHWERGTRACGPGYLITGIQPVPAIDAESAEVFENMKGLLK